jgi:hypothetical protein
MINLKKITLPFIVDKMKDIGSLLITRNVTLMFTGIDAVNMHFSNKAMHTGFIEFIVTKANATTTEVQLEEALKSVIVSEICRELNEVLTGLASDATCIVTRQILSECKADGGYKGAYFVPTKVSPDRTTIDFYYAMPQKGAQLPKKQAFVEIRLMPDLKITALQKGCYYYTPLAFVCEDVMVGVNKFDNSDWSFREQVLKQCLERSGMSISYWTFQALVRFCFPSLLMRKMKQKEAVQDLLNKTFEDSPFANKKTLEALKVKMLAELEDYKNDKHLEAILTFDTLYERSIMLGFFPEIDDLRRNLNNTYNQVNVREIRITSIK